MKSTLAAGFALVAFPLGIESLRYSIAADDTTSSNWTLTSEREVHSGSLSVMDQTQDVGSGSSVSSEAQFEFLDTFPKATEDGAPLSITRSYETVGSEMAREGLEGAGIIAIDESGASDLEGIEVEFAYDADAEEWSATFAEESDGDEEWLEELTPRVDLTGLLPDDSVDVGDT